MTTAQIAISGEVDPRFTPLRDTFADHFAKGWNSGAGLAVTVDGERVADLTAGVADRSGETPFTASTLTPVFSCTKAVTALVMAKLVDEGAFTYDQTLASVWPEFAAHGKGAITIEQALSHQAGLAGFTADWERADWLDWDKTVNALAAMAPLWPPGEASGYHAATFGYLAGEVVRRTTGRTLGAVLREDICAPLGLEFWIGLPEAEHHRVAEMRLPRGLPDFGEINAPTRAAFLERWSGSGVVGEPSAWLRAEIPSANGVGTAAALADLMQPFARDGRLGDTALISADASRAARAVRIAGPDLVLPYDIAFAAGLIANTPEHRIYGPSPNAVGHTGSGGSAAFADPDRGLTFAYVMTQQNPTLLIDDRLRALIDALYASL